MLRATFVVTALLAIAAPLSAQSPTRFLDRERADWLADLKDAKAPVRRGASFALGKIGNERDVDALVKLLADDQPVVRAAAATAIGDIVVRPGQGTSNSWRSASRDLHKLLNDDDARVRRGAAYALGAFGPQAVGEAAALRKTVKDDRSAPVRQNAAWALGRLVDKAVETDLDSLMVALQDGDALVRRDAATALADLLALHDKPQDPLDKRLVRDAVNSLVELVAREADPSRDKASDPVVLKTALQKVAMVVGPEQQDKARALTPLLASDDPEIKQSAAFALANIGGAAAEAALPTLRELLRDEEPRVQELAAASLGRMGSAGLPALQDLGACLSDDRAPKTRRTAALSISQILGAIHKSINELKTAEEQQAVQRRLDEEGPPRPLVSALARELTNTAPAELETRLYAAESLAHLSADAKKSALPDILKVLGSSSDDAKVRQRCVWFFFNSSEVKASGADKVLDRILDESDAATRILRYDAARVLAFTLREESSDKVARTLLDMLEDKTLFIYDGTSSRSRDNGGEGSRSGETTAEARLAGDGRFMAAEALGALGSKAHKPAIIEALMKAKDDRDPRLSKSAIEALRRIR